MRYRRNVQGRPVELELIEVDPFAVKLDPRNPRIQYAMEQLPAKARNEQACTLVLIAQEETESLKTSLIRSGGVQEPIYVRHDLRVAEGNRRVLATRLAHEEKPHDARFNRMPAWRIPKHVHEAVIQDLLNEIHIGSVRGWAPYERAMQIRALVVEKTLLIEEVAERYRMTVAHVQQQLAAADFMEKEFLPIVPDRSDPEHRSKYSYFLEFERSPRIRRALDDDAGLRQDFAKWVRDGNIYRGVQVRALPKVLASPQARRLLATRGFKAAKEYLAKTDATQHDVYSAAIELTEALENLSLTDLNALAAADEHREALQELKVRLDRTLSHVR